METAKKRQAALVTSHLEQGSDLTAAIHLQIAQRKGQEAL